jgi:4-amino-4-deoxy-L-arabinose transferase-like glycosyltransferase
MPVSRRAQGAIVAVVLLAIAVRVAFLILFPLFRFELTGEIHGTTAYDTYAVNLLQTGIYGRVPGIADSILPPLYSVTLAGIYGLFGRGGLSIGFYHIVLDVLSILMLIEIARRLFKAMPYAVWVGIGGGFFYAVYPYLTFQNLTLNDTALFMTLLHAFVLMLVVLRDQPRTDLYAVGVAALCGLILGLATLAKALLVPLAILAAFWFWGRWPLRTVIERLGIVALVSLLIVLPWIGRAYAIYGRFVAVGLNSGENVYQGANDMTLPLMHAGYDVQWSARPPEGEGIDEPYARNAMLMQVGLDWLKAHPEKIPDLLLTKFLIHWSIDIAPRENPRPGESFALDEQGRLVLLKASESDLQDIGVIETYSGSLFDTIGRPIHILYFGGLLVLAIAGIMLSYRQWREVSLLWAVQISMTLNYVIFHPSTRYRVPSDPLLFLFSAYTLLWAFYHWRYSTRPQRIRRTATAFVPTPPPWIDSDPPSLIDSHEDSFHATDHQERNPV